ncbi:MAG: prolipoprotein diacylglyceryl transferase [Allorhizobium sp.]
MHTAASFFAILPFPTIDPVAIAMGPLAIHWYGLAYVAGILIGWWLARRMVTTPSLWHQGTPPMTVAQLDDFLVWAALGIVLGGRIGYILFYDFAAVAADPLRALKIWNGGMSFHGGFLGATAAMVLFSRRNGVAIWSLFDIVASVAPIGIFFGRIANFVNGELWGRSTDVPWAIVFPTGGPFARHPSQLYEAGLEGLLLFLILQLLARQFHAFRTPGLVTGFFVVLYGMARIVVEFFREPDQQIGYLAGNWLTMGMVLSVPMLLIGLWAIVRAQRAGNKR